MILRTETVQQVVDGPRRDTFVKQIVMTPGQPIGMVRKRRADLVDPAEGEETRSPRTRGVVLLVHGFGQNRYTWHTSRRSFSAYLAAEGWDVFNVDLRGHGRSGRFDGKRPEALDEYVQEDVPACAREARRLSGHDRVVLIGHSMGGLISYSAGATKLRDVVRAIVTLGSPYRFGSGTLPMKALATVLNTARATGVFDANVALPLRYVGLHLRRRQRMWDHRLFPTPVRPWRPGSMEPEILEEYLKSSFETTNLTIAFDIFAGGDRVALRSRDGSLDYGIAFEGLQAPILVIAGDQDDLAPPSSCRAAYERSTSRDKLFRVFPAGHVDIVIGREAVSTIWPLIRDFLDRR
ncbi:MAG: alpha/beta hydrolase [Myxococcales bacterium]|nr:alpha/beta hydrolase [Myxococcales bacterium]